MRQSLPKNTIGVRESFDADSDSDESDKTTKSELTKKKDFKPKQKGPVQSSSSLSPSSVSSSSSSSSSTSYTVDHSQIIESELTKSLLDAFCAAEKKGKLNKADLTLSVIKATEIMLIKLGVDEKRLKGGFLSEVVASCEEGLVLNTKLSGFDAKTPAGEKVELKNSASKLGETTNVNISLPEEKSGETAKEYYARVRAEMISKKGNSLLFTHSYSTNKSNKYCFDMEFLCFYAESKDVRGFSEEKMGCTNMNIGGVSCVKCTRVHRLDKLLEFQKEWLKENSNETEDQRLARWKPRFMATIVQKCE